MLKFFLISFLLSLCYSIVFAEPATPLSTHNQNPLIQIHSLPAPTPARLQAAQKWQIGSSIHISNTLNIESSESEHLYIDGEIYRLNMHFEYGLNNNWAFRVQLPWVSHSSGLLDQTIDEFHETLNFKQGLRPAVPRDQFRYEYRSGQNTFLLDHRVSGPGDLQLMLARQLSQNKKGDVSLWVDLKLPTGDSEKLTGSGATDLAAWLAASHKLSDRWQTYGSAGFIAFGNADILRSIQEDSALFGHWGIQWRGWRNLTLKGQLDWHTAFYDNSDIRFLSDIAQLTIGMEWHISNQQLLQFSVTEDAKRDASPDVTFSVTWKWQQQ